MKAITKPKKIEIYEALKVDRKMDGRVLTDTPTVKQTIIFDNGQLLLREESAEHNENYKSEIKMDVYLEDGDMLIETPNGYMKPLVEFTPLSAKLKKAVDTINENV